MKRVLGGGFEFVKGSPIGSLTAIAVVIGTVVRIPQLSYSLAEAYAFRQTQTAMVAREYLRGGIDLRTTPLPVLGADANVPMEMPLYQALVAIVASWGLDVDMAARLVGLVSFQAVAILLFVLMRRWHDARTGLIAVTLLEFTPYGLHWGAASLIDFFALALALAMVAGVDAWIRGGTLWVLIAGWVAAIAAFLAKSTTTPIWGLLLVLVTLTLIKERGWRALWRRTLLGYVGPVIGFASAVVWNKYADGIKSGQALTGFLTSDALTSWNFGTILQRKTLSNSATIVERIGSEIVTVGALAVVIAVVLLALRRRYAELAMLIAWMLTALSGPLVFFNLYVVHDYYLIAVFPALVAAVALSISIYTDAIADLGQRGRATVAAAATATVVVSGLVLPGGRAAFDNFRYGQPVPGLAQIMEQTSTPDDYWIMLGCDWDPTFLYYADRKGVMFRGADSEGFWDENSPEHYTRLVVCSGAPEISDYLSPSAEFALLDGHTVVYEIAP